MSFHRAKLFIAGLIYGILGVGTALAYEIKNPINSGTFADVVGKIAALVAKIGTVLVVLFIIYAGLLFVTARGNEEQLKKAKNAFWWTLVGAAIVVGAYAIAQAVINFANKL